MPPTAASDPLSAAPLDPSPDRERADWGGNIGVMRFKRIVCDPGDE